jgi:hypothetical protein
MATTHHGVFFEKVGRKMRSRFAFPSLVGDGWTDGYGRGFGLTSLMTMMTSLRTDVTHDGAGGGGGGISQTKGRVMIGGNFRRYSPPYLFSSRPPDYRYRTWASVKVAGLRLRIQSNQIGTWSISRIKYLLSNSSKVWPCIIASSL